MKAVFKREFKAYFLTPMGSILLAIYYFFLGLFFHFTFSYGSSDLASVIISMILIIIFTVPVITMRSFCDDRKQKVDQVLFTSPVRLSGIVLGKFFAALCLFALCFAPTVIFEIIIACYVKVNILAYLYSLLGVMLLGSTLISIGMFISSLTENIVVSAVLTLIVNIVVLYAGSLAQIIDIGFITKISDKIAFLEIANSFSIASFSVTNVVFFLSITVAFLFLCVQSLEKRRWS